MEAINVVLFSFAASFYGSGYASLPFQDAQSTTDLSFRFRTSRAESLLVLVAGRTDYCLVMLQAGAVKVRLLRQMSLGVLIFSRLPYRVLIFFGNWVSFTFVIVIMAVLSFVIQRIAQKESEQRNKYWGSYDLMHLETTASTASCKGAYYSHFYTYFEGQSHYRALESYLVHYQGFGRQQRQYLFSYLLR